MNTTEQANYQALIGTILGDYRLEQLLEQRRTGPIFMASSKIWKTARVVRFLHGPAQLAPEARMVSLGRFQQEASHVASLKHPHILPLLDYGVYQGIPYLVYPHVPLVSLRALLAQSVPEKPLIVSRYLDQLASALEHAHQHTVLHRNLSTATIFMQQQNDEVVIAEFGLAYMLELSKPQGQNGHTSEGSSESVAPEQVQGRRIDTYTDTYALGAILYRMITGHPPFGGESREEVNKQHVYAEVPSVNVWRKGVPQRVDSIITKAMAKEPAQRFSRPAELADAFHDLAVPNDTGRMPLVLAASHVVSTPSQPLPAVQSVAAASIPRMASVTPGHYAPSPSSQPLGQRTQQTTVSRRRMITILASGGGVVAVAALAAVLLRSRTAGTSTTTDGSGAAKTPAATATTPAQSTQPATGANVLARTADVPIGTAKKFAIAGQNNPGLLIHLSGDTFVAYNSTCTHAGCAVSYVAQDQQLACPCHGAIFDAAHNGAVVTGPTQIPLPVIKIVVQSDGTITRA